MTWESKKWMQQQRVRTAQRNNKIKDIKLHVRDDGIFETLFYFGPDIDTKDTELDKQWKETHESILKLCNMLKNR